MFNVEQFWKNLKASQKLLASSEEHGGIMSQEDSAVDSLCLQGLELECVLEQVGGLHKEIPRKGP